LLYYATIGKISGAGVDATTGIISGDLLGGRVGEYPILAIIFYKVGHRSRFAIECHF